MGPDAMLRRLPGRPRQRGLTLIELLVALAIGLILTLAVVAVLNRGEGLKRTTTTLNDVNQSANQISYLLDRTLRSAGSGYAQRWRETFGCQIFASRAPDGQILPRPAASEFPVPFENVRAAFSTAGAVRLAPVLIGKGLAPGDGGDVLMVMTGTSGFSESPQRVNTNSATTASVILPSALGVRPNDLMLLADVGLNQCMLQQVSNAFAVTTPPAQLVSFADTYSAATIGTAALSGFSTTGQTYAVLLGNAANNLPQFQMLGVGANATLFSYDLLRAGGDVTVAVADGVAEMRALYGVTNAGNPAGTVDAWIDPADDAANWGLAALTDGTAAARDRLRRIVSIRVGLIMRSALPEQDVVAPPTLTLFPDLAATLQQTRTLTTGDQNVRHRIVDFTVPLRTVTLQDLP
jgi:type IV pilus assembly protein PilW